MAYYKASSTFGASKQKHDEKEGIDWI